MAIENVEKKYAALMTAGGGVVQTPQDLRDYVLGSKDPDNKYCPFQWDISKLPSAFSLYEYSTPRHDQGSYNSCVGNAFAKAMEMMHLRAGTLLDLSRKFIYYNARLRRAQALGETTIADTGCSIFIAAGELTNKGVCLESICPYTAINTPPTAAAFQDGLKRMVGRYERVGNNTLNFRTGEINARDFVRDVKVALNAGMPVVFGLGLTNAFYYVQGPLSTHKSQYNQPYFVTTTTPGYIGNHAMIIVGYDDALGCFIVENSWGTGWGDNGLIAMSYECLKACQFDAFAIREYNGERFEIPDDWYIWDAKQRVVSWDFDGVPGQVWRLYQAAFNRRPDWDGLGYHIYYVTEHGVPMTQIAENFTLSPEYQRLYGQTSNEQFVTLLYNYALYRHPEPEGFKFHVDNLNAGRVTRGQTMLGFSESPENKSNCMYLIGNDGIKYYPYTPPSFMQRVAAGVKSLFS